VTHDDSQRSTEHNRAGIPHGVQFYQSDDFICAKVAEFVGAGISATQPVVVIATAPHLVILRETLENRSLDVQRAIDTGALELHDAEITLAKIMLRDEVDADLFNLHIGGLVRRLRKRHAERPARAFGEMVDVLWQRGSTRSAVRLEGLWNELAKAEEFSLLCAYSIANVRSTEDAKMFEDVCDMHTHAWPSETFSRLGDDASRLRQIVVLEQRAQALEAEVRRREQLERDLKTKQAELEERETELRDFIENASECIHWVGPDGTILFANAAELQLLGYTREEYVGRNIRDFHVDQAVISDILSRVGKGETLRDYETRLRCKDGSIKEVLLHSNVYWRDGKFVHTRCFTRDVTERNRALEALREHSRINENLVRLGLAINAELDLSALVQKVADAATALCGAEYGAFFHCVVSEGGVRSIVSGWSGAAREAFAALAMPQNTLLEGTFSGRDVLRLDDMTTDPCYHDQYSRDLPWKSYLAVPVCSRRGEVLGGLFFGHSKPAVFRESDERLMVAVAAQAAVALDNARLFQATRAAENQAKREREALEVIAQELETANRTKDEFLATLSHELRTPLNAILGWVHMLRSDSLSPDKARVGIDVIERNANAQTRLIEDLLDVSRIMSGKLHLELKPVNVQSVIENAIEAVRVAAETKDIRIQHALQSLDAPTTISGDPDRLQQVVWNLLANAVKFTPKGGTVRIATQTTESTVDILVADNGQGIDPAFLPRVFERFRQADSTTSRRHGGLGLGLAIVRHLVELHGGTVKVESAGIGHGATFTVRLPIQHGHSTSFERLPVAPDSSSSKAQPSVALRGIRVLVVDDEPDAREMLAEILKAHDAQVVTARCAADALQLLQESRPDVLVSDVGMPMENGYALIEKVRALPPERGGYTPAVALTAYTRVEDRAKALASGFNLHVAKPVDIAVLIPALVSLTNAAGAQQSVHRS
jgi:PAS domain S-box-containing protein